MTAAAMAVAALPIRSPDRPHPHRESKPTVRRFRMTQIYEIIGKE